MQVDNFSIETGELLKDKDLNLTLVAGKNGLKRRVVFSKIQKPGLAFAGFTSYVNKGRVQIIGLSEIDYLSKLNLNKKKAIFKKFLQAQPACIVFAKSIEVPDFLIKLANEYNVAIFSSNYPTSTLIEKITNFLSEVLAPTVILHGDLLNIFGVGTLIIGDSGVGKSESALDLVVRGHRLIADDAVVIKKISETTLIGEPHPDIKNFIEVRGIGIVNINEMLGISSTLNSATIELIILLERWKEDKEYERLGIKDDKYNILGIDIPLMTLPVAPGRNIAMLIEIAVRKLLLKQKGVDSTTKLINRLNKKISNKKKHER